MRSPSRRLAVLTAVLLLCVGCAGSSPPPGSSSFRPLATLPPDPTPTPTPSGQPCSYGEPDPDRTVLTLDLDVQGRQVTGREQLLFTPDLPITEIVLRLWADSPRARAAGGSTTVRSVRVDGTVRPYTRSSPTMIQIPWKGAKGRPLTVDLTFDVTLPVGVDDRLGSRGSTSWLGTGFPVLAWERGRGWAMDAPTAAFAEATTSEVMRLARLSVRHAPGLTVVATGDVVSISPNRTVTRAAAVRDVAVAVGRFRTAEVEGLVPVTVAVHPDLPDDPEPLAAEIARALSAHAARFGPYPFGRVMAAVLPNIRGGIEYPGVILVGTGQLGTGTLSHEIAHQWFYGLVGNNQARDPWLDEAFATYAEAIDRNSAASYRTVKIPEIGRGQVGQPMSFWEERPAAYFPSVYLQGAVALLDARRRDPEPFDKQVRCYVAATAFGIARPEDVERLIPLAASALRRVGAVRD